MTMQRRGLTLLLRLVATLLAGRLAAADETWTADDRDTLYDVARVCYGDSRSEGGLCEANLSSLQAQNARSPCRQSRELASRYPNIPEPCHCLKAGWTVALPATLAHGGRQWSLRAGCHARSGGIGTPPAAGRSKPEPLNAMRDLAESMRPPAGQPKVDADLVERSDLKPIVSLARPAIPPPASDDAEAVEKHCLLEISTRYRLSERSAATILRSFYEVLASRVPAQDVPRYALAVCRNLPDKLPFAVSEEGQSQEAATFLAAPGK